MKALVVFESMFGDTRQIAEAVANGLASRMEVEIVEVSAAPDVVGDDVDLIAVGGPTHAFGLSRPRTRADASRRGEGRLVSEGRGLREWLAEVRPASPSTQATAFDTRIDHPRVPGSAASAALRRLRRRGFSTLGPAISFYVVDALGPLVNREQDRARQWAETIANAVAGHSARSGQSTTT